ncbi:MAG TPA: efflux RND transporter permease subunit [Verrucomicrobiae bacterium]|jgi:multidrug efflux pump subunit AcrB|nr:efflux RND transporter permease subunit [Verrucomicrobiae bacterium]
MWIVRLALRRPLTFVVAALLLLIITPFVLTRTPTDIFPNINIPVVSIVWQYAGMSAQEIEQRIVYNHERALSITVNDIEHIESTSYNGIGVIKVFLHPSASVPEAIAQIASIAQTVVRTMPPGTQPPLIIQYSASTVPILQYSFSSPKLSEQQMFDVVANQVRVGMATTRGALIPWPYGGKTPVISVDLNLTALKAKNLAPLDVVNAINAQNIILPGGTAKVGPTEYDISVNGTISLVDDLNRIPVKVVNGATIQLQDVAQVHQGYNPQQNAVRQDGERAALLTIMKNGNASTLDVVKNVKAVVPHVMSSVTSDLHEKEFADQSLFVRAAVSGVMREGIIAAALTALMILLFLGSWRSTLIIALSIPLSVLCSIVTLSALGETINLMTLGGLALAVGILVDDATVAIENIHRHMVAGKSLEDAIMDGAQEIALPAFVSTLCICIVFVPMFFLTGVAHFLFVPLAEAVVFAMLASYVISRTLVPTLVMWFYRNVESHDGHEDDSRAPIWLRPFVRIQRGFERGFERFRGAYRSLLVACLTKRGVFGITFLVFCVASWVLVPSLGQDFFPSVDAGQFLLHVRARTGTRIEETIPLCSAIDAAIRKEIPAKEIHGIMDNIGIPNSSVNLSYNTSGVIGPGDADILVSLNKGHRPTETYIRSLRKVLNKEFPGNIFYFLPADIVSQTLNFGLPAPFDIQLVGRDQENNRRVAASLVEQIRHIPGAVDAHVQQPDDLPRLNVAVDRTKAAEMGLTEQNVANSVLLSLSGSGQVQPTYWLDTKLGIQYLINVRVPEYNMNSVETFESTPINAGGNGQILANLATITRSNVPPVFTHYDVKPVIDVYGNVDGRDLGGVLHDLQPLIEQARKNLTRGNDIVLRGQARTMHDSYLGLGFGLLMAIVLIYFLLVINFQSWLDPFIIITALPGALAGVIWALFLLQTSLSVPALMGAIMSLGVATANSVLVVSFARDNLMRGMEPMAAALDAGEGRIRPVLMTAAAMLIGMLPMSLGLGEGGEQNAPLGRAVIGGLFMATVATLLFVPVVFSFMHRRAPAHSKADDSSAAALATAHPSVT